MSLPQAFAQYLTSNRAKQATSTMVASLAQAGLTTESTLLQAHIDGIAALQFPNSWTAQSIALGMTPPLNPRLGDYWFDPIELVLCIFVPATEDWAPHAGGWFSMHPLQRWQYDGFVLAIQFEQTTPSRFPLFELENANQGQLVAPVTGLYSHAASILAQWLGKSLIGSNMEIVQKALTLAQSHTIMPPDLNLWAFDTARREDLPMAYNQETAAYEDFFELLDMDFPPERKLVYDEWERSPWVGLGTYVPATGFQFPQDGNVWPFVRLLNMPLR